MFSGTTPAHRALMSQAEQLRHEVIAKALALDPERIWIEKVQVQTRAAEARNPDTDPTRLDALAELERLAGESVLDSSFVTELIGEWQLLLEKLPTEVRDASKELADLRQASEAHLQAWVTESLPLMMDRVEKAQHPDHDRP